MARLYSYVVEHDVGFAPNPYHGVCSLAACKPQIRETAELDDVIVGTGSKRKGLVGRLIYWMKVDRIITFDQYWSDPRFRTKRPTRNGSLMQQYGDNIYHHDPETGEWLQENGFHSAKAGGICSRNLARDTKRTQQVLLANEFVYWGGQGPAVPPEFSDFVRRTQGHLCRFAPARVAAFKAWLFAQSYPQLIQRPADWPGATL